MMNMSIVLLAQAAAPGAQQGAFEAAFALFDRGGPVMWPILVCSLMGLTVTFERLFAFWKYNTANFYFRKKQGELIALTRKGRFDEAVACAKQADSPACRVLAQALVNREAGFAQATASSKRPLRVRAISSPCFFRK